MLEVTSLNKCYKMVVLRALLDLDAFWEGLEIMKVATACREFILSHPVLRYDLPPTQQFPDPATAPIEDWARWWLEWPLTRWMDDQGGRRWFKRDGDRFLTAFSCTEDQRPAFESMTAELVDYRLAHYAKNRIKAIPADKATSFVAKVSHSGGKPILWLPTVEQQPGRPVGPTKVKLPDGTTGVFRFVKVACNVVNREESDANDLPELLRSWFGPDAGLPGTGFQVSFERNDGEWAVRPVAVAHHFETPATQAPADEDEVHELPGFHTAPPIADRFTRLVPVFTLEAAAGLWGPESTPEEIGWIEVPEVSIKPGMFVAKVRGHSMEPKIRDGQWCLFRPCRAGSREGRVVLVQFNAQGDPDDARRFTVKRYHSVKRENEDGWNHESIELRPINPDYPPIKIAPLEAAEMLVVGELVRGL